MEGLVVIGKSEHPKVPLKRVSVEAHIKGYLVKIDWILRYNNDSCSPLEVVFRFPLDESLAVTRLEAIIDGRKITASIMEKEEALNVYDNALTKGLSAAYGQEVLPDIFTLTLGNLPPGSSADITLCTVEELEVEADGALRFALSSVLKDRYTPHGSEDPLSLPGPVQNVGHVRHTVDLTLMISNPEHVAEVISPTHTLNSNANDVYTTSGDGDVVILIRHFQPHQPFAIVEPAVTQRTSDLMSSGVVMLNYFPKLPNSSVPCELVFVVDRSGSMAGQYIKCAAMTLQLFLRSIPSGCFFNVIGFGSHFKPLFDASHSYDQDSLGLAASYALSLKADFGGTELLPALQYVFEQPVITGCTRQVFVLTDGAVSNTDAVIQVVRKNSHHTRYTISVKVWCQ